MTNALSNVPVALNEPVLSYEPGSKETKELQDALKTLKNEKTDLPVVVGAQRKTSGRDFSEIRCPHDHSLKLGKGYCAEAQDVGEAIDVAVKAQQKWQRMPWEERAAVFLRAASLLAGPFRARMNAATILGQSKNIYQAEIDASCELIDFWRFNTEYMRRIYEEQPQSAPGMWNRTEMRGLEGYVLAITPFNFSSIAINLATAPALMGCSVLWKPAPQALLSAKIGLEILEKSGLPPGVVQILHGKVEVLSDPLLSSPFLSGIHFTGSTQTFNHLWQKTAQNLPLYRNYPRIVGETGGKDFVFAHESADVQALVTALVRGAFEYQGQKCSAASRAYLPRSLWPKVKDLLVDQIQSIKLGSPEEWDTFMGAVIDEKAFQKIKGYIEAAKKNPQNTLITGGGCHSEKGWFIEPTVFLTQDPKSTTMVEEIFGPVLTIYLYDDFKAALELCEKTSPYALTGALFADDREVIHHMKDVLLYSAGNLYINDKPTGAVVGQQPFGGGRLSGTNDKAGSMLNLLRWCSMRTTKEVFVPPTSYAYPHMALK